MPIVPVERRTPVPILGIVACFFLACVDPADRRPGTWLTGEPVVDQGTVDARMLHVVEQRVLFPGDAGVRWAVHTNRGVAIEVVHGGGHRSSVIGHWILDSH